MLKPVHCLWILSIHTKLVCSLLVGQIVLNDLNVVFFSDLLSIYLKLVCPPLDNHIVFTYLNMVSFSDLVLHDILLHISVQDQLKP